MFLLQTFLAQMFQVFLQWLATSITDSLYVHCIAKLVCSRMRTEATLNLETISLYMLLLAHAHSGCFGLTKKSRIARWKVF